MFRHHNQKRNKEISWVVCLDSKEKKIAVVQDRKNRFFFLALFFLVMETRFKGKGYMLSFKPGRGHQALSFLDLEVAL